LVYHTASSPTSQIEIGTGRVSGKIKGKRVSADMRELLGFPIIVQICLAFGVAGLLWPEKVKGWRLLWFPWIPSYRAVRYSSIGAILFSVLVFALFVVQSRGVNLITR
jgi:hypothetical protein